MAKSKAGSGNKSQYPQNKPSTTGNKSGRGRSNNTGASKGSGKSSAMENSFLSIDEREECFRRLVKSPIGSCEFQRLRTIIEEDDRRRYGDLLPF